MSRDFSGGASAPYSIGGVSLSTAFLLCGLRKKIQKVNSHVWHHCALPCGLFKERFLDPDAPVDAGACPRDKKGSTENTARRRRDLKVEEEEEEEEAAGEKRQIWAAPRGCQG